LHLEGWGSFNLDDLWPGVTDQPLVSFLIYLVVLDFCDYWYHRAQHGWRWLWALHSLHHSQENMNLWSDDRNHVLDDLLRDVLMGVVAIGIGVQPGEYVLLVSASRMLQSLQHANVRIHFGRLGEYLLVSPRFTACITRLASVMRATARIRSAVTILQCCSRSGMCCFAPRISARVLP